MTDLVVLSDLHLGPGYDPGRGGWNPLEALLGQGDEQRGRLFRDAVRLGQKDMPTPNRPAGTAASGE